MSNLFIADGGTLVSGGRTHPTMTIQAPAFRAAEHISKAREERLVGDAVESMPCPA